MDLTPYRAILRGLIRTDPDPRVRHRADALLLLAGGLSVSQVARAVKASRKSVHRWAERFLTQGWEGLVDRPRRGRPRKLDGPACALLEQLLTTSPLDAGYPATIWTVADLRDALPQHGYRVSGPTVYRALERLGYRDRRPRHDLRHHKDVEAVDTAKHVLAELQKGAVAGAGSRLIYLDECTLSTCPHLAKS